VTSLPRALRRLAPDRLRHDVRLRALGVGAGLIPPRTMHSAPERELLVELARGAGRVVEIGVYEGASAVALARAMGRGQELHLIDPFGRQPTALPAGWAATEGATRRVVARAAGDEGPCVRWHVARSQDVARGWSQPVDLVFVDGDHAEAAVRADWEGWRGHVVPGGHLLFHDARLGRPGGHGLAGPSTVVADLLRDGPPAGWRLAAEVDRTVALRRTGSWRSARIADVPGVGPAADPGFWSAWSDDASFGTGWRSLREHLGIRAFGVNANEAAEGHELVVEHDELPFGGQEELYVVLRGRARFTCAGEEVELASGDALHVDADVGRRAVALETPTLLLSVGGVPGRPYAVPDWAR
jgi:predicted O-methyltransferase YrrM